MNHQYYYNYVFNEQSCKVLFIYFALTTKSKTCGELCDDRIWTSPIGAQL